MKRIFLASVCLLTVGCAGSSSTDTRATSRFPGHYLGTYVNVADPTDFGTSDWYFENDGMVQARDVDGTDFTVYIGSGRIDAAGNLDATSVPHGGTPVPLTGNLKFNLNNELTGNLLYSDTTAATYTYTLRKQVE